MKGDQERETANGLTRTPQAVSQLQSILTALRRFRKGLIEVPNLLSSPDASVDTISSKLMRMFETAERYQVGSLVPVALEELTEFQGRLDRLKKERSDVRKRREDFVGLAKGNGWSVISTGSRDHVGPYTVTHVESNSTVSFGKTRILKLSYPSGLLLLKVLEERARLLNANALNGWDAVMEKVLEAQERISPSEPVSIEDILAFIEPNVNKRRRLRLTFCFRLALLVSGMAPGEWRIMLAPPALSEQAKAWTIPRLDRTNDIVRLRRFRVSR